MPQITSEIMAELFAYLGGLVKELKGMPIRINGMPAASFSTYLLL